MQLLAIPRREIPKSTASSRVTACKHSRLMVSGGLASPSPSLVTMHKRSICACPYSESMESVTVESPCPSPLVAQKPLVVFFVWSKWMGWESLDCTGGFFSMQRWKGIRIDHLLDQVTLHPDARYVSFISVTSYRWSLPLGEAHTALLATH